MTSDTKWLDAAEQRAWRSYLRGSRLLEDALRCGHEHHGLSAPEYEILVRLSEAADHRLRMSELANSIVSSRSRLTHTVNRLERAGLVARRSCSRDGRGVDCLLTPTGMRTLEEAAHTHVRDVRENLMDAMSRDDFLKLGQIMASVADRLDPEGRQRV
ncbi:MAG: MarR family winged helix-turn-helix transcriptional regulator [Angustibacter sp.]